MPNPSSSLSNGKLGARLSGSYDSQVRSQQRRSYSEDTKQQTSNKEKKEGGEEEEPLIKGKTKQEVNFLQKILAVLVPLAVVGVGAKVIMQYRTDLNDDTMQVDMNSVMSYVFQKTVYNVLDNKQLIKLYGEPLLVEPTRAKFSFTKDYAWISYPLYTPTGHVCTVTVDLLRIDPNKPDVKTPGKPHMWYVAQIEADQNDGRKMLLSTTMDNTQQPFDVIQLFYKIFNEMKQQEEEFLRQQQQQKSP